MTLILGLHFGHDSHAVVFDSQLGVLAYYQREKHTNVKSQAGIDATTIKKALKLADVKEESIDFIAVTNTQYREFIFEDPEYFTFQYSENSVNTKIDECFRNNSNSSAYIIGTEILSAFQEDVRPSVARAIRRQYPDIDLDDETNFVAKGKTLRSMPYAFTARDELASVSALLNQGIDSFVSNSSRYCLNNLFIPIICKINGISKPGFVVDHHYAHTCSVAYKSGYNNCMIFSSDGSGASTLGNLVSLFIDGEIYPYLHTSFRGGQFYEQASALLRLECGKFMGLSGYGKADPNLVSLFDDNILRDLPLNTIVSYFEEYYSVKIDSAMIESNICKNFAAVCQSVFERSFIRYCMTIFKSVQRAVPSIKSTCLTGGTALNCPANSLLAEILGHSNVFVEPSCNDEGLGMGAILACYSRILGGTVSKEQARRISSPFLGATLKQPTAEFLEKLDSTITICRASSDKEEVLSLISTFLNEGKVGLIASGPAEIGPRALGNRSIIALPTSVEVASKVNRLKNREQWRPLAPAVLQRSFPKFFRGPENPYMLMTCQTELNLYPGITHVDGSARVQCVTKMHQNFYDILNHVETITGKPCVILNTSLNRKGEPTLNDIDRIFEIFEDSSVSFLLLDEYFIYKPSPQCE